MTKFVGGFDYDQIKAIITSGEGKAIIVDPDGNIVGDIPLSTLARTRVYEQSFEDGTSDLTADNATQTVQSSEVYSGSYALQVTVSAEQTGYVETPVRHVSPSQEITVVFAHKEDANITDVKLIVVWYRTNMRELATEEFTLDVADTWKLESRTVTAPKKAAYMAVRIQATAGSSDGNIYVDDITIDLVGQIFRVDGAGQIKVADTDLLDEIRTKLDVLLSTRASENTLAEARDKLSSIDGKVATEDTLSAIKNALDSVGTDKIRASIVDTLPESPFNLSKVAGTALTGRDWSSDFAKLQNLDLAITALRDALKGANNKDFSTLETDVESILAKLDVALSTLAKLQRWGRNVEPTWIHGDEVTAPTAGTKLVSKTVSSGKKGYIYGFFIMSGEANDFKINWTSGGATKSIRIPFGSSGALQYIDIVPLNEGLPADSETEISITNVNAGSSGVVYQARLLIVEV